MPTVPSAVAATPAQRLARRAWARVLAEPSRARTDARRALAMAATDGDRRAEAWSLMALGYHQQYFGTLAESAELLRQARGLFEALDERAGALLATAVLARTQWRGGQFRAALDLLLPLRDEALSLLRHHDRAVLLNAIAGGWSALGDSEQAIAYMHEALRDAGPRRGNGFDAVLHCNLANELTQLGDCEQALRHVGQGLSRMEGMRNPYLQAALLINRVIILTDLGRAAEALPDIHQVLALPTDASGRGGNACHFECLAIAALNAGDPALGERLVALAQAGPSLNLPDERLERGLALALLAWQRQRTDATLAHLDAVRPLAEDDGMDGLSLRVRCQYFLQASQLRHQAGQTEAALADLRHWQLLHQRQDRQAHRAHYRSAALQSELVRLTHRLQDSQAKRQATERSRAQLAAINEQLARKIAEVQSLQEALRQQAIVDALTGLHNRRHLNEVLPTMLATAQRSSLPLAVVIIDLDHFKQVNDQHGHQVGDALLASFGQLLASSLRRSDLACRYGGEEFCLLLPRSTAASAQRKVQALLRRWRQLTLPAGALQLQGLSFSAGVADSGDGRGAGHGCAEHLLRAADQALLRAKASGRNRVLLADPALVLAA
ncbi:MAG: diguanylate cyclase [Burkholderiaceae bacterium]|nr:diguanylate cyclase [Burkholderiaceae bacterium]